MRKTRLMVWAFVLIANLSFAADKQLDSNQVYELRSKCGKQAEELYNCLWGEQVKNILSNYENHYNPKRNKCLIWVTTTTDESVQTYIDKQLIDINKHEIVAELESRFRRGGKLFLLTCDMLNMHCKSEAEWNEFVKLYMEE